MTPNASNDGRKAYIITGPTSGIGYATALEVARHGSVVLVGRDAAKLSTLQEVITNQGGHAVCVVCDLSDMASVQRAAAEIKALNLPIAGLLNNAGIREPTPTQNALGWDMSFATNHLGPFALTEALIPHLPDAANVVFIVSAVENPERQPAKRAGFRGSRYISAEASARGEWMPGGSVKPGFDSYATSKQCSLVTALAFTREFPRLRFRAVEPGVIPTTGLGRNASTVARVLVPMLVTLLRPFLNFLSTPKHAAEIITRALTDQSAQTGVYFGEHGQLMRGSDLVHDPKFQDRVVTETRALLASVKQQTATAQSR